MQPPHQDEIAHNESVGAVKLREMAIGLIVLWIYGKWRFGFIVKLWEMVLGLIANLWEMVLGLIVKLWEMTVGSIVKLWEMAVGSIVKLREMAVGSIEIVPAEWKPLEYEWRHNGRVARVRVEVAEPRVWLSLRSAKLNHIDRIEPVKVSFLEEQDDTRAMSTATYADMFAACMRA
jgi:hypothetical protein